MVNHRGDLVGRLGRGIARGVGRHALRHAHARATSCVVRVRRTPSADRCLDQPLRNIQRVAK